MYLFLSDLHLGRGSWEDSRRAEADACVLLRHYKDQLLKSNGKVFLVGDVFNAYMEFRALVPTGYVRFTGLIAELCDLGIPVIYVSGNRDHWQLGHFAHETGALVLPRAWKGEAFGRKLHVEHGDFFASGRLNRLFRNPVAYAVYRTAFPGDLGFRLAAYFGSKGSGESETQHIETLRNAAAGLLASNDTDIVVFAHSHHAECTNFTGGTYLNPGYWFADRTYGVLDTTGPNVMTWPG